MGGNGSLEFTGGMQMAGKVQAPNAKEQGTMAVAGAHNCDWKPRGGNDKGKQWQIDKHGGTLASMVKDGTWRCTGCGQAVQITKKL